MDALKQKKLISGMYFFMYFSFALSQTQLITFLTRLGYSAYQRGLLLSSCAFPIIVLQVFVGYFSDKYRTIKKIFIPIMIFTSLSYYLFFHVNEFNFLYHFITLLLGTGILNCGYGLADSWTLESGSDVRNSYSYLRIFASIGWGVASICAGRIAGLFFYRCLGGIIMLFGFVTAGIALMMADAEKSIHKGSYKLKLSDLSILIKNKEYVLLIIILYFICSLNLANSITVIDKLLMLGASEGQIGYGWAIRSIIEIPMFFAGTFIMRRFDCRKLIFAAAAVLSMQFLFFSLATTVTEMILLSILQCITIPFYALSSRLLVFELVSGRLKSSGQLIANALTTGAASFITAAANGLMLELFSVDFALVGFSLMGAAAALVAIILIKMKK